MLSGNVRYRDRYLDHIRSIESDVHHERLPSLFGWGECVCGHDVRGDARWFRPAGDVGLRSEAGVTLVEVIFTMALTLVTFVLVWPAMDVITKGSSAIQAQATDEVTVGATLVPLTDEISSAAVVYSSNPASGTNYTTQDSGASAGNALLVLGQLGNSYYCYQWAVVSPGELETRSWIPGSSTLTPFRPVSPAVYPVTSTPFALTAGSPPTVTLALDLRPSSKSIALTINTTISATNVGSSTMASQCETAPNT